MTYCPTCGAEVQGKFCAKCGTSVAAAGTAAPPPAPPSQPAYGAQPSYQQPPQSYQPAQQAYGQQGGYGAAPPPPPGAAHYGAPPPGATPYAQSQSGGLTDNMAGALCYVLTVITGIIFLVVSPYNQNKFVRFHAFQSIFFWAAWIALFIGQTVLSFLLPAMVNIILGLLSILIWLGGIFVWAFLIYKAYNNEKFKLPIIGDLAEKQA